MTGLTCEVPRQDDSGGQSAAAAIYRAAHPSVYDLFLESVRRVPHKVSLSDPARAFTYAETRDRVDVLAQRLLHAGIEPGNRIAVLSENCIEYVELLLAAARIGAMVACQNWRLQDAELEHCIALVSPAAMVCSPRFRERAAGLAVGQGLNCLDWRECDGWSTEGLAPEPGAPVDPEAGLMILYTSGTTGPAKAAVISHRALMARMQLLRIDLDVDEADGFVAWSPMFHMGGSEHSLSTLMIGGTVFVADGFDAGYIAGLIGKHRLGWLLLVPATIERLIEALNARGVKPLSIKRVGAMADLLPKAQIAQLSSRLDAPFLNTFGATETGIAPASRGTIPPGETPVVLSKTLSSMCALRLVDEEGRDVVDGTVGEAAVRGPTLFSGYWDNEETNARDFADGWFRMGDLFRRNADGSLDFCGRAKYLIKSGGENIYPAEIEAVLLANAAVQDAIVVAYPDTRWGEVPVAVLAANHPQPEALRADLLASCRRDLARYKCPRDLLFIDFDELPRSTSGKIVRQDVEAWLVRSGQVQVAS